MAFLIGCKSYFTGEDWETTLIEGNERVVDESRYEMHSRYFWCSSEVNAALTKTDFEKRVSYNWAVPKQAQVLRAERFETSFKETYQTVIVWTQTYYFYTPLQQIHEPSGHFVHTVQ